MGLTRQVEVGLFYYERFGSCMSAFKMFGKDVKMMLACLLKLPTHVRVHAAMTISQLGYIFEVLGAVKNSGQVLLAVKFSTTMNLMIVIGITGKL